MKIDPQHPQPDRPDRDWTHISGPLRQIVEDVVRKREAQAAEQSKNHETA